MLIQPYDVVISDIYIIENHPPVTPQKFTASTWSKEKEEIIQQMRVCLLCLNNLFVIKIIITTTIRVCNRNNKHVGRKKGVSEAET